MAKCCGLCSLKRREDMTLWEGSILEKPGKSLINFQRIS